ncbi:uncharacterized protein LOC105683064 isoform X2 [Athalia rosae]|uniref:uncharacterized protein LOC105683064 isoform X2 n=1 Tax=Athalia rosae TaxID=37344 RepID=UPI0020339E75|nr:uncharacterized protein LOC105683064 isoform X2 [Athalia rosae]XP_048505613.1 uncharacterized protein LOC105683064 isoform X2 [Athalia rosae]
MGKIKRSFFQTPMPQPRYRNHRAGRKVRARRARATVRKARRAAERAEASQIASAQAAEKPVAIDVAILASETADPEVNRPRSKSTEESEESIVPPLPPSIPNGPARHL